MGRSLAPLTRGGGVRGAGGGKGKKRGPGESGERKGREEKQQGTGLSIKAAGINKHHLAASSALTSSL